MKQKILIVVCLLACLCMQLPMTVLADTSAPVDAASELAQAIIDGRRPPLSTEELQSLSDRDKQQLAIALGQCRQAFNDQEKETSHSKVSEHGQMQPSSPTPTISEDQLPVLDKDKQTFISYFAPFAQRCGQRFDLYPSIIIAQAILESSWGQSALFRKYHNPLGVKGAGVCLPTLEQDGNHLQAVSASFRAYKNIEDALIDYGHIMQNELYTRSHRSQTANYQEAISNLKGKYATDALYDQKLTLLIKHYHLDRFDKPHTVVSHPQHSLATKNVKKAYKVKTDNKEKSSQQPVQWQWPLAGGAGSIGILEIVRRLMK